MGGCGCLEVEAEPSPKKGAVGPVKTQKCKTPRRCCIQQGSNRSQGFVVRSRFLASGL